MLVFKAPCKSHSGFALKLASMILLGLFLTQLPYTASASHARELFEIWQLGETTGQQSPVTAIVQSRDGYIWLGTYHGLVRFDGVRSVIFDSSNTRGLQNGAITSLFEDSDGVLWIGHETGQLTRYVRGSFEPVWLGNAWPGGTIETIAADEQQALWVLNDTGLLLRVRDGKTAQVPGGVSPTRKAGIVRSANGKLWIVCGGEIATLDHATVTPSKVGGPGDYYERVLPSRDGGLWLLGNQRLRKWRDGRWVAELSGPPRSPGSATVLLETRSGMILVGMLRDGLYAFTPSGESFHFSQTNGLSNDWVRSLCEDQEGNLWVGTAGGLDSLRPRKVQMLSAPDAFHGCSVLSFVLTGTNSAWVGTEGAGLYQFRDGHWTAFTESTGIPNLFVWSVLEAQSKDLFVGTWGGGIVRLSSNANRFETSGDFRNINAPVVSLYEGRKGELWIGTTAGLYRFEQGKQTWFVGKERLTFPDIRAIAESNDGTIWFGMSGGGLASLQGDSLKQFRKQDGLGSDFVISLYCEPDGTIWAGTSDNGLMRCKNGTFSSIGVRQGLPSSVISHLVDDGAGHLWIGSHAGILRVSKDDLNRCAEGAIASVHCLAYGKAEGLVSQTCAGGFQPGACRSENGAIWFPTTKGIAIVDPANVSTNTCLPPVVLEEMLVDGRTIDLHSTERLDARGADSPELPIPAGAQKFEFRYTGLSFVAADKVQFKYRLLGLEDTWTEPGTRRVAEYSYLRPGPYRFQVLACNNDGLWNESGAFVSFTVLPYLWQTLWFQVLSGSSVAIALGAAVFWAVRRQERLKLERSERQHALERERARIARDIHDDLGASLTRITMLSQSVRAEMEAQAPAAAEVDQIYSTARELTRAMDEIVWAVNPKHDTLDSLVTYLGRFAQQFLSSASIRCRLDLPVYLPSLALTSEVRHNVFLAFKEALNNTLKHAAATEVRISLRVDSDAFELVLADNGRGFNLNSCHAGSLPPGDPTRSSTGNGLANMKKRLEEIGGHCDWDTALGEGTRVKFVIKTHDS